MNLVSIFLALFGPWILFVTVFAALSFSLHYESPEMSFLVASMWMLVIITIGFYAWATFRAGTAAEVGNGANWYIFNFLTSLLAWSLAVYFGYKNFYVNMQPYYDMTNLNHYADVDVTKVRGQQFMDAGKMVFKPRSQLETRYAMGFKNLDMYCVAPVARRNVNGSLPRLSNYDFWAVGLNCCSGDGTDFQCGHYKDKEAHAGLRLMRDEQRPFFRLAVQQAMAAHNIKSTHPIFIHWVSDPVLAMYAYKENGFKSLMLGMLSHFLLQSGLVAAAAVGFAKLDSANS
jgi:hypothetical protein